LPPPKGSASRRCGSISAGGCWRCRNAGSGFREYSEDDRQRLAFIRRARQLGFTLGEIGDLLGSGDGRRADDIIRAAEAKLAAISEQIRELAQLQCRLRRLVRVCAHGDSDDCAALHLGNPALLENGPDPFSQTIMEGAVR
jgi:DNA-binding transcriptional MerR regulator